MYELVQMSFCPACKRAQHEGIIPDQLQAGTTVLLAALVNAHTDERPTYKFTHTKEGHPAVTSTEEVDKLLGKYNMAPIPIIPFERILHLYAVGGMQLNTHYMHLEEFNTCRGLASELFDLLTENNNNDQ